MKVDSDARAAGRAGRRICKDCAGAIDSLVELLQGRLSKGVMERICAAEDRALPVARARSSSRCSCPDWATMCKHVAAVLYGVGARLDEQPELLFRLRGVDEQELIARAGTGVPLAKKGPAAGRGARRARGCRSCSASTSPRRRRPPGPGGRARRRRRPDPRPRAADRSPGRRAVRDREAPGGGDRVPGPSALYEPGRSSVAGEREGRAREHRPRRTAASTSGEASRISSRAASRSRTKRPRRASRIARSSSAPRPRSKGAALIGDPACRSSRRAPPTRSSRATPPGRGPAAPGGTAGPRGRSSGCGRWRRPAPSWPRGAPRAGRAP